MIDPNNIKSIGYDYQNKVIEITLKESMLFDGFNRNIIKMKCDYEKFTHYLNKWLSLKLEQRLNVLNL